MTNASAQVAVINYGMGNLRSVVNAFAAIGAPVTIAQSPEQLAQASHIVLPGVGAFGDGMKNLQEMGWIPSLETEVRAKGKPFLGICLGMQLLATLGTEHGDCKGLGWIDGIVERLPLTEPTLRIPHIGWNDVEFRQTDGLGQNLGDRRDFYFVHSYAFLDLPDEIVSGVTIHGCTFISSLHQDNLYAVQFHPEKSQKAGLMMLQNFIQVEGNHA
ncbi:MAG: imidazole glycerol phosphate synthase subunit HisH [Alkalinema sp. CACIAM 70d]|nr:MAG: imidazole glycerol phosphate synthase subunit HisH [Alkalinema sp. CACIAM 70d]